MDTPQINLDGVIGGFDGVRARDVRRVLDANRSAETVNVRIHSRGGDVLEGFAMFTMLAEHPGRIVVDIDGEASSMASFIAMAGTQIRMSSVGLMMIHNPWGVAIGDSGDLRALASVLDKMKTTLAAVYASRSGRLSSEVLGWMNAETWMTAEEAKARGFIDKITGATLKARAERTQVQPNPIVPAAVARAGLTAKFAELAERIIATRDPAELERLLAARDALIAQAQGAAPRAAAEADQNDADAYGAMPFIARARLKQSDPARFNKLVAAHTARVHELGATLNSAKTFAERQRVQREIAALTGVDTDEGPSAA